MLSNFSECIEFHNIAPCLIPAFGLIFGVFYLIYWSVGLAVNTKANILGMTREFLSSNMDVFTGNTNIGEIQNRVWTALDQMSHLYE